METAKQTWLARHRMRCMLPLATCFVLGASACVVPAQTDRGVSDHGPSWNRKAAAAYLDQRTTGWMHNMGAIDHGTFCVSCHTGLPYALTRSALRADLAETAPSPTERALLDSVTKRVRLWKEVKPFLSGPTELRGTEAVLNALVLVTYEAHNSTLSDDARQALDVYVGAANQAGRKCRCLALVQPGRRAMGGPGLAVLGATLAAVAIGTAPRRYQTAPEIQDNLKLMKAYLQQGLRTQSLLNRLAFLACYKAAGATEPRTATVHRHRGLNQTAAGWGMERIRPGNSVLETARWNPTGDEERRLRHRPGRLLSGTVRRASQADRVENSPRLACAEARRNHRLLARLLVEQTARPGDRRRQVHERRRDRVCRGRVDEQRPVNRRRPTAAERVLRNVPHRTDTEIS